MRWLDSKECEHYWEKDANREKILLRTGWDEAQKHYNKLKQLGSRNGWFEAQKHYNKLEQLADNKTVFYSDEKWA